MMACFVQLCEESLQEFDRAVGRVEATDDLDGRLEVRRIHDMQADDLAGPAGGGRDPGDGKAGSIRAETNAGRHEGIEFFVDRAFDLPPLGNILDDHFAPARSLSSG